MRVVGVIRCKVCEKCEQVGRVVCGQRELRIARAKGGEEK